MKIMKKMFLLIIVALILILGNCSNTYAQGNINVKMSVGFENYYKFGYWTPFNFNIENKLKDINGEIQIELINEKDQLSVYSKEINIPLNATKNITLSGILFKSPGYVNVKILNGKEIVYEEKKPIKIGTVSPEVVVGILSDEQDNLDYTKGIKNLLIGGNSAPIKNVKLGEKDLIDVNNQLDIFNIILLNDFDTSKLSEENYKALKSWVNRGGILIIGTGSSYNKTLRIFKDDFLNGSIGDIKKISSSSFAKFLPTGIGDGKSITVNSLEMKFKEGNEILKEGNDILSLKINKGDGVVCINSFDFGEAPIASWKFREEFLSTLMERVLKDSKFGKYYTPDGLPMNACYGIASALTNIIEMPLPKGSNIIIIICIYILLVSPLSYLILKKKDKREYMWVVVPIMSFIFVFTLYITGMGTRITKNIANMMNIVNIDRNGQVNVQSYANIFSPKKANIKIQPSKGMEIYPSKLGISGNEIYNAQNINKQRKVQEKINEGVNGYIEFYNLPIFSNNFFEIKNYNLDLGKIESDISYYDDKFIGKIKNSSSLDLEECYVMSKNNYIKVGNIKSGQEKNINSSGKVYNELYNYIESEYRELERYPKTGGKTAKSQSEIRKMSQRRDMISGYFEKNRMNIEEPILLGWSNKNLSKDFIVNGKKIKKYEKNLVIAPVNMTFTRGNKVQYPFGYFKPEYSSNKDSYNNVEKMFYGKNHEIMFNIKEKIDIENITIKYRLDIVKGKEQLAKQFIWNVKEGKWQEGDFRDFTIDKKDLGKYLSPENTLKIKLETQQQKLSGEIPQISVKGSVK